MCIQTELNRLINIINEKYQDLDIQEYTIENPYDFTDKTPLTENNCPELPRNFCIINVNKIDYIQFSKKNCQL